MQKEIVVDGTRYLFKLKIGVVEYPSDGEQSFELFENLTIAIEKAKDSEDIVYYNNSMKEPILRQLIIESELEKALELDEFTIFYQPQINSQTNRVTGIEALLRWNNKALGPVSPGEFIQVAENSGMIIEIGYWIIENICKQLKEWEKTITVDFKVAINISPMQFNNVNFFELLKDTLTKYGVDHSLIEVEITEGIFLEKYDQINEKLRSIQINGITIAVDDFGTGFSSLSYLKNLNIDKLKIDRAFIKDFPEKDDGTIAYIIAHLAQKLDLEVIAEGVETLAQIDYLKSINCFEIQGFYYSKPLPAKGIYDLIVERNGKKKH